MTEEELRESLENELAWRLEEMSFFKNILEDIERKNEKDKYRKSLVLLLYSHLEGFIKFSLLNYAQYLNALQRKRKEFDYTLIATSMDKEFKAYENRNSKSPLFKNSKIPSDSSIHNLYRRVNLLESSKDLLNKTLIIDDNAVDTESNLWYIVLRKNLYRLGLPDDMFAEYEKDIDALVNRRNSIAHGGRSSGVQDREYAKWETSVKSIMESIIKKIYLYTNEEKYLQQSCV